MSLDITNPEVRVLVVDDSAFMRTALSRMIESEPGFTVAGTACSGAAALARIETLDPDVVSLDMEMPGLSGLETLRLIMAQSPRPVIVVSAVTEKDAEATFDALSAGAFDYVPKHLSSTSLDILHIRDDLIAKIQAAALSRNSRSIDAPVKRPPRASGPDCPSFAFSAPAIVALGSSTGGPKALEQILTLLPQDLSVPILIVQHMPAGFTGPFAQRLNTMCRVAVREAAHRELIRPGVVYIAPAGTHMTVERSSASRSNICLDTHPEDSLHIPSVNVMMKSVADAFSNLAMGIILTGMGCDGAEGMQAIYRRGGFTVGQDEASCTVYGMPRACAELSILSRVVPLSQIPAVILQATRYRKRA